MKLLSVLTALATVLASAEAVTQAQAEARFKAAGITWSSTGGCTTKSNPKCTSFSGLQEVAVNQAIVLKKACACDLVITGGTEAGHAKGEKSHENGWKLDFRKNTKLNNYVKDSFTKIKNRSDGYPQWQSNAGNVYCVSLGSCYLVA